MKEYELNLSSIPFFFIKSYFKSRVNTNLRVQTLLWCCYRMKNVPSTYRLVVTEECLQTFKRDSGWLTVLGVTALNDRPVIAYQKFKINISAKFLNNFLQTVLKISRHVTILFQVVIDAFRLINPNAMVLGPEPRQTTSNLGHLQKPSIQVFFVVVLVVVKN